MFQILTYRLLRKYSHLRGQKKQVIFYSNKISSYQTEKILREKFDESIPPVVNLEICNDCNYKCPFCPQSQTKRPSNFMTMESFLLVMNKCKESGVKQVYLFVNNEPFLHPDILEFCRIASDSYPEIEIGITTNGSLIKDEQFKYLANLAHPPVLTVNDYTPNKKIMPRIEGFQKKHNATGKMSVTINDRSWNEAHKSNRGGSLKTDQSFPELYADMTCTWPFIGMFFDPNLKGFLCCSDYKQEIDMGDLTKYSIMEIWKGQYGHYRLKLLETKRRELPLCKGCDAEWYTLPAHCE